MNDSGVSDVVVVMLASGCTVELPATIKPKSGENTAKSGENNAKSGENNSKSGENKAVDRRTAHFRSNGVDDRC